MSMSPIAKFVQLAQQGRVIRICELMLNMISNSSLRRQFHYKRLIIFSYEINALRPLGRISSLRIREGNLQDADRILQCYRDGVECDLAIAQGHIPIIAETPEQVVGIKWFSPTDRYYERESRYLICLPKGGAWSYGMFIDPRYRLSGLWVTMTEEMIRYATAHSFAEVFCAVEAWNDASLKTQARYGTRRREEILFIRIGVLHIYMKWVFIANGGRRLFGCRIRLSPLCDEQDPFIHVQGESPDGGGL